MSGDLARIRFARQDLASPSPFDWMDDAACRAALILAHRILGSAS